MDSKELTVIAGPNGSGKTTFAQEFLSESQQPYLSADLIASQLAPDDPATVQVVAGRKFIQRLDELITGSKSFVVESTLSGRGFRRTLERAKLAGFEMTIVFVYLNSPDTCVARVQGRVRRGGHNVPEADVQRRFWRSIANFWQIYRRLADQWMLIHNAGNGFQQVALGTLASISISDETRFNLFLELAGEKK